ncbi:MAG: tetratricopeptide repeat protein [Deltaproteobacteria bacterium]|nr:tetratricopeptide repeat protein [Deltaproteobacteria bacterium]
MILVSERVLLGSGIFLLLVLSLALPVVGQQTIAGRIVDTRGEVMAGRIGGQLWAPAQPGQMLEPGDGVQTGYNGWAALLMADETLIQVNKNSVLILEEVAATASWHRLRGVMPAAATTQRSSYRLQTGETWLRNANPAIQMDIQTPTITAAVRGTELNLLVTPDNTSILTILEGRVSASNAFGDLEVAAREQVVSRPGMALQKRLLLTPEDTVQWTLSVPTFLGPRDVPLFSSDQTKLHAEQERLAPMVTAHPTDIDLLVRLGEVKRDLGLSSEAEALFQRVVSINPDNSRAWTGLGWTWMDKKDPQKALECFLRVPKPEPMTYLGASVAYGQTNAIDQARSILHKGIAGHPDFAAFALQDASLKLIMRELTEAKEVLTQLITRHPDYSPAHCLLALVLLTQGDREAAVAHAQKGVQLAPYSPTPRIVLSYSHQARYELEGALASTLKALELDPTHVLALIQHATLLFASDHTEQAWQALQKAEHLAPDDAEVLNLKGFLLLAQRKPDPAIDAFREAIKVNPGFGEPHLGISIALMRIGDTAAASEEITTAILLEPRRSLFLSYWAKMLYQLRRFRQAVDTLDLAGRLDPRDPTPELYRGIILRDLYRPTEAIEALNKAIALNDNRAVYRSRFLLDRDLAVKSVSLSILYNQLGLSQWGASKALASVEQDYTNFAGHLFLAGALFETEDLGRVAASEALLARMLQPANPNSFNTFNEYTLFFDAPSINGTVTGAAGSFDTYFSEGLIYGGVPRINTAFSASAQYARTDGWRGTNPERIRGAGGYVKWDPTPRDGFMLAASTYHSKQRDVQDGPYAYSTPPDPFDLNKAESNRVEIGYHHHFAPNEDLLLSLTHYDIDTKIYSHDAFVFMDWPYEEFGYIQAQRPYYQAQGQYHWKFGDHQWILGTVHYWGENNASSETDFYVRLEDELYYLTTTTDSGRFDNTFNSIYLQDLWTITPQLALHAAAYYDRMHMSNAFIGTEWTLSEFNPRLGLVWRPAPAHTFRLAGFRYLLPFDSNRIDPLEVAGIPIFRNAQEGAIAREADLTWEYEWSSGYLSTNLFYLDRRFPYENTSDLGEYMVTLHGHAKGFKGVVNQMLFKGLGFTGAFWYSKLDDENTPDLKRQDYRLTAGLKYVHPTGLSASIAQTYRLEDFDDPTRSREDIWLTDGAIAYDFPQRKGSIALKMGNLFDNHFDWVTDLFVFSGRVPRREISLTLSLNF